MLIVTGHVTAKADTIDEMMHVSLEHVHRSRLEPGCISHEVSVDAENPLRLIFLERWESPEALRTHFAVKESRVFWKRLQELAADPGGMKIYEASRTEI
ncbi:MAG: antibiotic biosynthesis monooxygenase [Alphaproteobacteria bacterium]|nr:antibiotic biosynthesis monooxygenase [Alphaproteobacteria bacterium]